jgi:hypothetical protein
MENRITELTEKLEEKCQEDAKIVQEAKEKLEKETEKNEQIEKVMTELKSRKESVDILEIKNADLERQLKFIRMSADPVVEKQEEDVNNSGIGINVEKVMRNDDKLNKSAFLQCGIAYIPPESKDEKEADNTEKVVETESEKAIARLERDLFEREDHYERELEVMRGRERRARQELEQARRGPPPEPVDGTDPRVLQLREAMKTMDDMAKKMREQDNKMEEMLESEDELNKSVEVEKNDKEILEDELVQLRGSVETKVKKATLQQRLELETAKSELERTRVELDEARDTSVLAYQDVFEEHEEILDSLRELSDRKRKRILKKLYKRSKKRRLSNVSKIESTEEALVGDLKEEAKEEPIEEKVMKKLFNSNKKRRRKSVPKEHSIGNMTEHVEETTEEIVTIKNSEVIEEESIEELVLERAELEVKELEKELETMSDNADDQPSENVKSDKEKSAFKKSIEEALLVATPKQPKVKKVKTSLNPEVTSSRFQPPQTLDDICSALEDTFA